MASFAIHVCPSCKETIEKNMESYFAVNEIWHIDCFRCNVCQQHLGKNFFAKGLTLYCRDHFFAKFGQSCRKCASGITGPVMVAGDLYFHPECFVCFNCGKLIGDGDEYLLEDRSHLFCGDCHRRRVECRIEDMRCLPSKYQHTIHHFQLSPHQLSDDAISLSFESKTLRKGSDDLAQRIQEKCSVSNTNRPASFAIVSVSSDRGNSPLQHGDKLLEVNGVPVNDETVHEISMLLKRKGSELVGITIERNDGVNDNGNDIGIDTPQKISKSKSEHTLKESAVKGHERRLSGSKARSPVEVSSSQQRKREKSLSFFNFSMFKRTSSDTTDLKRKKSAQTLTRSTPFLPQGSPRSPNPVSPVSPTSKTATVRRSNSLTDLSSDGGAVKELAKTVSHLQRAQSFKVEQQHVSQVFRPADLKYGDLIGAGFFGEVFQVTDTKTGEVMVMKKLKLFNKDAQENFLKEVQLMKTLNHPNVLRFIGVMYKDKILHIITEYVTGGTLRKLLKNPYRELTWKQKVKFAKDIAAGMAYLHDVGIIHRDLTSKNCLLRNDEFGKTVVVADFGLAKIFPRQSEDENGFNSKSKSSNDNKMSCSPKPKALSRKKRLTVVGSPYWMAPEMMRGLEYNERVDVFSFGICVCEIIGRVKADPDFLPRTEDYGLNASEFKSKFCDGCPDPFFNLAVSCCVTVPEERPSFLALEKWLEVILANLEFQIPLPEDIDFQTPPRALLYRIEEGD